MVDAVRDAAHARVGEQGVQPVAGARPEDLPRVAGLTVVTAIGVGDAAAEHVDRVGGRGRRGGAGGRSRPWPVGEVGVLHPLVGEVVDRQHGAQRGEAQVAGVAARAGGSGASAVCQSCTWTTSGVDVASAIASYSTAFAKSAKRSPSSSPP